MLNPKASNGYIIFHSIYSYVHNDEKWIYLRRKISMVCFLGTKYVKYQRTLKSKAMNFVAKKLYKIGWSRRHG